MERYRDRLRAMTNAALLVEACLRITLYLESERSLDRITGPEKLYYECFWQCDGRGLRAEFDRLRSELIATRRAEQMAQWQRIQAIGVK